MTPLPTGNSLMCNEVRSKSCSSFFNLVVDFLSNTKSGYEFDCWVRNPHIEHVYCYSHCPNSDVAVLLASSQNYHIKIESTNFPCRENDMLIRSLWNFVKEICKNLITVWKILVRLFNKLCNKVSQGCSVLSQQARLLDHHGHVKLYLRYLPDFWNLKEFVCTVNS